MNIDKIPTSKNYHRQKVHANPGRTVLARTIPGEATWYASLALAQLLEEDTPLKTNQDMITTTHLPKNS